jgi:hypothetical protein
VPGPVLVEDVAGVDGTLESVAVYVADCVDTSDDVPLPLGVTVKVYCVPVVSPVTVHDCLPVGGVVELMTVHVRPLCATSPT